MSITKPSDAALWRELRTIGQDKLELRQSAYAKAGDARHPGPHKAIRFPLAAYNARLDAVLGEMTRREKRPAK